MKTYDLTEFTFLLKLGLWNGGRVSGLGYVSAAKASDGITIPGLNGIVLGSGIMLERSAPGPANDLQLTLSVYNPYAGRYDSYTVLADFNLLGVKQLPTTQDEIEKALTQVLEEIEQAVRRSGNTGAYTPFREKLRYEAAHSSVRTGRIATPRRKR